MISLDTEQLKQLREIGSYLSQIRQDQSKTLEEISTKTFIPVRLLKAIEAAQEKILPEPVFIQGFIRRYGDALGLNGKEISQRFNINPMPTSAIELTPEPTVAESVRPAYAAPPVALPTPNLPSTSAAKSVGTPPQRPPAASSFNLRSSNPFGNRSEHQRSDHQWDDHGTRPAKPPYALMLGAAAIALAGLFFGVIRPGLEQQANSEPGQSPPPQASVTTVPAPTATMNQLPAPSSATPPSATATASISFSPTASPQVTPAVTANAVQATTSSPSAQAGTVQSPKTQASTATRSASTNAPMTVSVSLTDESWVEIMIDGKRHFEGILQKGFKKTWSAKKNFTISSGNAGAVKVSYNNGAAKPLGEMGAIETKSFTPSGASAQPTKSNSN